MIPAEFIDAIKANPADDLPRLIVADWLDEHGHHDRAEFIRVQIARYNAGFMLPHAYQKTPVDDEKSCHCDFHTIIRREREIEANMPIDEWLLGTSYKNATFVFAPLWERGFVHTIQCTLNQFTLNHERLMAMHPISHVALIGADLNGLPFTTLYPNTRFSALRSHGYLNDVIVEGLRQIGPIRFSDYADALQNYKAVSELFSKKNVKLVLHPKATTYT